jgi:predicted phage tail protein
MVNHSRVRTARGTGSSFELDRREAHLLSIDERQTPPPNKPQREHGAPSALNSKRNTPMRTTLSALLLAAAFVSASAGAKAADTSIENAGNQAIVFAAKGGTVALPQAERSAPVFTADQTRGIVVNPGAMNSGR